MIRMRAVGQVPRLVTISGPVLLFAMFLVLAYGVEAQAGCASGSTLAGTALPDLRAR